MTTSTGSPWSARQACAIRALLRQLSSRLRSSRATAGAPATAMRADDGKRMVRTSRRGSWRRHRTRQRTVQTPARTSLGVGRRTGARLLEEIGVAQLAQQGVHVTLRHRSRDVVAFLQRLHEALALDALHHERPELRAGAIETQIGLRAKIEEDQLVANRAGFEIRNPGLNEVSHALAGYVV